MGAAAIDYHALAEFRYQLRRFLHFSEEASRAAGLEPRQHQLLLALKGLPSGEEPTVSELAERLQIKHHSTVELIDRLAEHGFVRRCRDDTDRRKVLLEITSQGERVLQNLSVQHRAELKTAGPALLAALESLLK